MKNRKGKEAAKQKVPTPAEQTPAEVAKAYYEMSKLLVYVLFAALMYSVYICQKMQMGFFYWPAE